MLGREKWANTVRPPIRRWSQVLPDGGDGHGHGHHDPDRQPRPAGRRVRSGVRRRAPGRRPRSRPDTARSRSRGRGRRRPPATADGPPAPSRWLRLRSVRDRERGGFVHLVSGPRQSMWGGRRHEWVPGSRRGRTGVVRASLAKVCRHDGATRYGADPSERGGRPAIHVAHHRTIPTCHRQNARNMLFTAGKSGRRRASRPGGRRPSGRRATSHRRVPRPRRRGGGSTRRAPVRAARPRPARRAGAATGGTG